MDLTEDQKWRLLSFASAVGAAVVVRAAIRGGYKLAQDEEPPLDPLRRDAEWSDAILFGVATGATVGLARIVARAVAAEFYGETHPIRERLLSLTSN